eukprot:CAMPEP_0114429238 /NCGR_PEP_ID=MMETSP0103-20121206/9370_1 /TAXON_ID=37642 ORGANISM="Paraphysomonas imperforata, Strain PA2" /NCGR_SAMPLE_ID=MMETSP0103 /ASSEMBLY_ACC=CAM_ASM_000201 /LENGTH=424 /DNA_ID=CAMNT_0001598543 /DNA_START=235 /DNA_END=1509 /DNA_ORIENTATION=-
MFCSIDVDGSKDVDIAEVLVHLHVEKTFFNKRVFGLLDTDASGELNFEEFMVGLWNYCSVEDIHFEHFAFDLYDADHSGNIDIEEAQYMVKDIYGAEFEHNVHAKRAYHKLAELEVSKIDFKTFSAFTHKHQAMLYPAFALQMNLKKYIMGNAFWHRQAQHRLEISRGQYRTITDLIGRDNFHSKRKLHKRNSDLTNMFRRGSSKGSSLTSNDEFSAPGAAYLADGHEPSKRRGSNSRRGSKDARRGSKDIRRGSKTSVEFDPLHGHEKAGARRGSKIYDIVDESSPSRRGSKTSTTNSPHSEELAGRRGSRTLDLDIHSNPVRRGSKIENSISPGHGQPKTSARRGSKVSDVDAHNFGHEKAGARRGSKTDSPNHTHEKAGARRGSKDGHGHGHDHGRHDHKHDDHEKKRKHSKSTVIPVTSS